MSAVAECLFNPIFRRGSAVRALLGSRAAASTNTCDDSGCDLLAPALRSPTVEQERTLFLRLNYFRYRVMCVLAKHRETELSEAGLQMLLRWERAVTAARGEIVAMNMPLVLAMAKRTRITGVDPADLISEGNLALLRSVDKFDCARGFKFSTYACRAILKSFSRVASRTARYRGYFPAEFDPTLEKSDFLEIKRETLESDCVDELRDILGRNLACLSDVEAEVIRARFALEDAPLGEDIAQKARTLEQVGEMIGVTKERVRQIQNKALDKLRVALEDGILSR